MNLFNTTLKKVALVSESVAVGALLVTSSIEARAGLPSGLQAGLVVPPAGLSNSTTTGTNVTKLFQTELRKSLLALEASLSEILSQFNSNHPPLSKSDTKQILVELSSRADYLGRLFEAFAKAAAYSKNVVVAFEILPPSDNIHGRHHKVEIIFPKERGEAKEDQKLLVSLQRSAAEIREWSKYTSAPSDADLVSGIHELIGCVRNTRSFFGQYCTRNSVEPIAKPLRPSPF